MCVFMCVFSHVCVCVLFCVCVCVCVRVCVILKTNTTILRLKIEATMLKAADIRIILSKKENHSP